MFKEFFTLFGTWEFANWIKNKVCLVLPWTKSNIFHSDKFAAPFLELSKEIYSHSLM